jgi:hypothetical protein
MLKKIIKILNKMGIRKTPCDLQMKGQKIIVSFLEGGFVAIPQKMIQ